MPKSDLPTIPKEKLNAFETANQLEWLVTNGIGGYASSSLCGGNTRTYHGMLIAADPAPAVRTLTFAKVEERVTVHHKDYDLSANVYPGVIQPTGYLLLQQFEPWPCPTFEFAITSEVTLRKEIWMEQGRNTTFVRYTYVGAGSPITLNLSLLTAFRSHHTVMHAGPFPHYQDADGSVYRYQPTEGAPFLTTRLPGAAFNWSNWWNYRMLHAREAERGLEAEEGLYCPGSFTIDLTAGESVVLTLSAETSKVDPEKSWADLIARQKKTVSVKGLKDEFGIALIRAADAFLISGRPDVRSTVIAGYHWFTDWGRDTMISLPGLCLTTGRSELAADILRALAGFEQDGMIPNRFPDVGEAPEYNTVDAALWFIHACAETIRARPDDSNLRDTLWQAMKNIIAGYTRGTRFGIRVDPADGLVTAGQAGEQLTWMDARIGDYVVTPRAGKPVEINALWHHANLLMAELAPTKNEAPRSFELAAEKCAKSMRKQFLRQDGLGLYDVITPSGPDDCIRPNQIFAVSLRGGIFPAKVEEAIVQTVQEKLLTPRGLRTLDRENPNYRGTYTGDVWKRDTAYHQGTVWPWLLGAFAEAHFRVHGDVEAAKAFLTPMQEHFQEACVGSFSEVFDGDYPHVPNGCVAQAWSIAEVLRVWKMLQEAPKSKAQ
ncbi:MAG: amylo-alpha-1,6-glucosidase [Chthonomonadales bacterium]